MDGQTDDTRDCCVPLTAPHPLLKFGVTFPELEESDTGAFYYVNQVILGKPEITKYGDQLLGEPTL